MSKSSLTTSPEISLLLRILDEAYAKKGWHGANLRGSLRNVTSAEAMWRPTPSRHSIWELAVHAAYWKYAVRRRLTGEKRGSFKLEGSNWFEPPDSLGEKEWKSVASLLDEEHRALRNVVEQLPTSKIHLTTKGSKVSNATVIYGVAAHDAYHTGQIQLLKRLVREASEK